MSIPNDALQKLLQEIEQKAAVSQQQIAIVKAQIAGSNRENRLIQLTTSELDSLPADTNVYEGVGKMFLMSNAKDVKKKLSTQSASLKADSVNMEKRLHYLETTAKNSRAHIDQMLNNGART